jgi:(2Fe-2S) ferredoxin
LPFQSIFDPFDSKTEKKMTTKINDLVHKLNLKSIHRHIFLCCDQAKPKCCSTEEGLKSWKYLKTRLKELGLDRPNQERTTSVFRTKADCLRVCCDGPIMLIYPDGTWYRHATPEVIEKIIQSHLINDEIVEEYLFHQHPLTNPAE